MDAAVSRRTWLGLASVGVGSTVFCRAGLAADAPRPRDGGVADHFPRQDPELVQEVVGASHSRLDRVRELVEARPELAKAAWDWGFGDWETALGAASHVGRRDIAEVLLAHGARPDLFSMAMMGQLEAVRACIEANPGIERTPGPHGISLIRHAEAGRERAVAVVEYLRGLGDTDSAPATIELTDEQKSRYVGRYRFGDGELDALVVSINARGMVAIQRGADSARPLLAIEPHAFAPAGAVSVRVRFEVDPEAADDGHARAVSIHAPEPLVRAVWEAE